jgi:hypothetical protein
MSPNEVWARPITTQLEALNTSITGTQRFSVFGRGRLTLKIRSTPTRQAPERVLPCSGAQDDPAVPTASHENNTGTTGQRTAHFRAGGSLKRPKQTAG